MHVIYLITMVFAIFQYFQQVEGNPEDSLEEYCCKCTDGDIPQLFDKMTLSLCTNDGGTPCPRLDCKCSGGVPGCGSCCECIKVDDSVQGTFSWGVCDALYTPATCPNNTLATWCIFDDCSCNGNTVQCNGG